MFSDKKNPECIRENFVIRAPFCKDQSEKLISEPHLLKGTVPSRDRKKAFFPDFFSHRKKHRRHKNFGICFGHILDFINKKNYIRKISNGRVIHVLQQRLDTVRVKLREL